MFSMRKERLTINNPSHRRELAENTGIRCIGSLPKGVFNEATVALSNYIGQEGDENTPPFLDPSIEGLVYFAYLASQYSTENRVLAIARKNTIESLRDQELAKAVEPALISAVKEGRGYTVGRLGLLKIDRHLRKNRVLVVAPATTTRDRGIRYDLRTGVVRFAVEKQHNLIALAMRTSEDLDEELRVEAVSASQIPVPSIRCEYEGRRDKRLERRLRREANYAIALWTMAEVASLLPDGSQRGEIVDPEAIKQRAVYILRGLSSEGLYATGGFM